MKDPPQTDGGGDQNHPEYLVAPIDAPLLVTAGFFGELLLVRLDAGTNHRE